MAGNQKAKGTASQLVQTKLHVPYVRGALVHRPRLIRRLQTSLSGPLTLIVAPAGYGKTTLVNTWSAWNRDPTCSVAWVSLDSDDNQLMRFLQYLIASLSLAGLPADSAAGKMLDARYAPNPKDFATVLVNELLALKHDTVLFLDDYHLIQNPTIHEIIAFIVEHGPQTFHTVLLSRSDPPLPLERLRARGRLAEIRFTDLRFTSDEIGQFFRTTADIDLSPSQILELETRTEGWVTALQLTALVAQGRTLKPDMWTSAVSNNRFVLDYLMAEVVASQPEDVREFLGVTAVLERMCAPLCDALLEVSRKSAGGAGSRDGESEAILRRLDQANLFVIRLDETGKWYRYHHLFRDFLRSRLGEKGPSTVELHRCASDWYQSEGLIAEAMSHALATRDWGYAASVLETCGLPILMNSEMRTIFEWTDLFPATVVRTRPMLSLMHAWAPVLSYCRASRLQVEEYVRDAEAAAKGLADDHERRRYSGHAALVRCFLAMIPDRRIDPREEVDRGQRALALFPPDDPIRCTCELTTAWACLALRDTHAADHHLHEARRVAAEGPDYFCEIDATYYQILIAREQGRLGEVVYSSQRARSHYKTLLEASQQQVSAIGAFDIAVGSALAERNQLCSAEEILLSGLDVVAGCAEAYHQLVGHLALARVYEAQGRHADADQVLVQLQEAWPDVDFLTKAVRVQGLMRGAQPSPQTLLVARSFAEAMSPFSAEGAMHLPGLGPCGCAEAYYRAYSAWAYAEIALGRTSNALVYLEAQLRLCREADLTDRIIGLSVAKAQALLVKGQVRSAHDTFREALALGEREGYVRVFDEGHMSQRLLERFASDSGPHREYAAYLLGQLFPGLPLSGASPSEAIDGHGQTIVSSDGEPLGLPTRRELEILRLVAEGCSNPDIAGRLFIELGTVKQHLNRTMRKLNAATRAEAVARARMLGVLEDR